MQKIGFVVAFLLLPVSVFAGNLVLHPNGFGENSYCSWVGHQGLADAHRGDSNQALYFQKMTLTSTFAAAVAKIEGINGTPVSALTGLSFYVRSDGHCGAGAPRWNVTINPGDGSGTRTYFIGCAEMLPRDVGFTPDGKMYVQRTMPSWVLPSMIGSTGTVTALSIVFDEGTDQGSGYTYLDNIAVEVNGVPHRWTSAYDNGNH